MVENEKWNVDYLLWSDIRNADCTKCDKRFGTQPSKRMNGICRWWSGQNHLVLFSLLIPTLEKSCLSLSWISFFIRFHFLIILLLFLFRFLLCHINPNTKTEIRGPFERFSILHIVNTIDVVHLPFKSLTNEKLVPTSCTMLLCLLYKAPVCFGHLSWSFSGR